MATGVSQPGLQAAARPRLGAAAAKGYSVVSGALGGQPMRHSAHATRCHRMQAAAASAGQAQPAACCKTPCRRPLPSRPAFGRSRHGWMRTSCVPSRRSHPPLVRRRCPRTCAATWGMVACQPGGDRPQQLLLRACKLAHALVWCPAAGSVAAAPHAKAGAAAVRARPGRALAPTLTPPPAPARRSPASPRAPATHRAGRARAATAAPAPAPASRRTPPSSRGRTATPARSRTRC
jgi:hypothetical protein